MFVEADLSQKQNEIITSFHKRFYPFYTVLRKAKKDCYPKQDLLDHTTRLY